MNWDLVNVECVSPSVLHVHFADGTNGKVRFEPTHFVGVFSVLKDSDFFSKVYLDHDVVTWPGEIDLAPDAMYAEIKRSGKWILS